jgi:hypothetical protein
MLSDAIWIGFQPSACLWPRIWIPVSIPVRMHTWLIVVTSLGSLLSVVSLVHRMSDSQTIRLNMSLKGLERIQAVCFSARVVLISGLLTRLCFVLQSSFQTSCWRALLACR